MEKKLTLNDLFESCKDELITQLQTLTLPRDAQKVQDIVTKLLSDLMESDGKYRQSLTQAEDYILQASLQLLQAQQNITDELAYSFKGKVSSNMQDVESTTNTGNIYSPLLGAGLGAVAGGILGTWVAVCGAIAGTAVAIYCANKPSRDTTKTSDKKASEDLSALKIDANSFCSIISKICQSIDNLMETFRIQVKKVENIYKQAEKPSLLNECEELFNQIANVYKNVNTNKDNVPSKVQNAVELLVESLQNYGLTIKDGKVVYE